MKSKEDLFNLIQAMSRSEKRYFTLDAQKSGKRASRYLELFQAINAMEEYREDKLKKKFSRNLPSDKAYLYEAILRSMRDYRSAKSLSARIKELLLDAKYLHERGLYQQSDERLKEADRLATELDDRIALLEINRERRALVWNFGRNYEKRLRRHIDQKDRHMQALSEEFRYLDICDRLTAKLKQNFDLNDPDRLDDLREEIPDDFQEDEQSPKAGHARRRYYQSLALYNQLTGETEKVAEYYAKVVDWWEENPKLKEEEFYRFIIDLSNLLHAHANLGRYHLIPTLLNRIENLSGRNAHEKGILFQKTTIYRLLYYINTGRTDRLEDFIDHVRQGLDEYAVNPGTRMAIIFNMAVLLFIKEDFSRCVQWCDRIIADKDSQSRRDIQKDIHLLWMIAHYESSDYDAMEQCLRQAHKHFKSSLEDDDVDGYELSIFHRVKKLTRVPLSEKREVLADLVGYLKMLQKDNRSQIASGLDELIELWAESRLKRRPISKLMNSPQVS